jgi:hypothetical protein
MYVVSYTLNINIAIKLAPKPVEKGIQ